MLAGGDPAAALALTAWRARTRLSIGGYCPLGLRAVHALRDPARELESAGARVFVDEDAVRQAIRLEGRVDFLPGGFEPRGRGGVRHVAATRSSWRHSSSAAIAASQTWSSF